MSIVLEMEIFTFYIFFQYCFAISYRREGQRIYELRANSETDLKTWLEALREAR